MADRSRFDERYEIPRTWDECYWPEGPWYDPNLSAMG